MLLGPCKRCGKVDKYKRARYCNDCKTYYFKKVNDYVEEHPGVIALDACKALNVDKILVEEFIEEDSFDLNKEIKEDNVETRKDLEAKRANLENALKMQALFEKDKEEQALQLKRDKIASMHFINTDHKRH